MGLRQVFEESASKNREGSMMLARDDQSELKRTPLHALHVASGGKMVPFAGYDMPVQYTSGVLREHLHTRSHAGLSETCVIEPLPDRALIALQGPKAESVLAKLCADVALMRFMDAGPRSVDRLDGFVSRSGYTGEDGFEISVPAEHAERLAKALLGDGDVLPIGLGARDSLRLEAGLCLYGHDIDATTT